MTETIETKTVVVPDNLEMITPPPRGKSSMTISLKSEIRYPNLSFSQQQISLLLASSVTELVSCSSAEEIATYLHSQGVKGDRSVLNSCPISNWGIMTFGYECEMDEENLNIRVDSTNGSWFYLKATPAMKEFIKKFDDGCYPELVA
jgi:hypothetical protein